MVMDKRYAMSAKIVETFFDPLYNEHFPIGFTGDFESKRGLAEAVHRAPGLVTTFAPLLRSGYRPTASEVTALAREVGKQITSAGIPSFGGTLFDFSDAAIDEIRDEFTAESIMRTTTWPMFWAMTTIVANFANDRGFEVEVLQDEMTRFEPLIAQVRGQPGIARVELVNSKTHLGVQLADLLCGFVRTIFAKVTVGIDLDEDERATCADFLMLKQAFESWNGNLPDSTWLSFIELSVVAGRRRYGTRQGSRAR